MIAYEFDIHVMFNFEKQKKGEKNKQNETNEWE